MREPRARWESKSKLARFGGRIAYQAGIGEDPTGGLGSHTRARLVTVTPGSFSKIAKANKESHNFGTSVDVYPASGYKGYRLIVVGSGNKTATASISPSGEIGSVTKSADAPAEFVDVAFQAARIPNGWHGNPAQRDAFFKLLESAHGTERREYLDENPAAAAEQYKSGRDDLGTLNTPLIAFDPALDSLGPSGAAFLDCPDVETLDHGASGSNNRLQFLANSAMLSSAFLVVLNNSAARGRNLREVCAAVREHAPHAPVVLLLNRIDPEVGQPTTRDLLLFSRSQEWSRRPSMAVRFY